MVIQAQVKQAESFPNELSNHPLKWVATNGNSPVVVVVFRGDP